MTLRLYADRKKLANIGESAKMKLATMIEASPSDVVPGADAGSPAEREHRAESRTLAYQAFRRALICHHLAPIPFARPAAFGH